MDVYQADRLREKLAQENLAAEVVTAPDVWDLPARFRTVLFPAAAYSDRELKLDVVEQGFHVLEEGGLFITLSEYEKDQLFAKAQKKVFGKCGESPKSKFGMAFWSTRTGDRPRRRHEVRFHAKIGDGPSMAFATWPGTFGYGRMDDGSRAMLEVAEVRPGDHVLDMGCGNGSVGCLAAAMAGPTGKVTFVDSNVRAVALADHNAKANGLTNHDLVTSATLGGLPAGGFDVVLANPPYYANSEVARLFIGSARDLLKSGGRFYLVTKMPVQTIPEVVETFGDAESVENRGYTILVARV
jgi:16S rRNA (guanine1207-N2)-methyltransferase